MTNELEALWEKIHSLFESDKVYASVDIKLKSEELEFSSIEELKRYTELPNVISEFTIYISDHDKGVLITQKLSITECAVSVYSDSAVWCAGAIEMVYSFIGNHKTWYSWFNSLPLGWFLIIFSIIPAILSSFKGVGDFSKVALFGWWITLLAFGFIYIFKGKILPVSTLVIRNDESIIKKHSVGLSLGVAVLSITVTIIGWFVN